MLRCAAPPCTVTGTIDRPAPSPTPSFVVEDGGSKNGTRLGGRAVERAPIADGDWIACGPVLLRFSWGVGVLDPQALQAAAR